MSWRSLLSMLSRRCPAGWELSRAFSEGLAPELAIHLRRCEHCSAEWDALERTRAAASALPAPELSDDARERLVAALLAEVGSSGRVPGREARTGRWVLATVASLAVVVALLLGGRARLGTHGSGGDVSVVAIHAIGAATFTRERPQPDELVRLDEGTLQLDVAPLRPGQRLRIVTADTQVETDGARLEVSASARELLAVRVWRGHAELRGASFRVSLKAGDQWTRAARAASLERATPEAPAPAPTSPPRHVSVAEAEPRRAAPRSPKVTLPLAPASAKATLPLAPASAKATLPLAPAEVLSRPASAPERASFERGWRLLRAGDPRGAGDAFRDVERQAHGDAIAEDAAFWLAVAEARAGASREAREAFAAFISRFPGSARAGEASAMLGWLLLGARDVSGAKRAFERASADPVDRVRESAQAGLARIAAQASDPAAN